MGSVAVLHPQDVLKDPKPLISSSSSMRYSGQSPNFPRKSNPESTLSKPSNRRKRSPQKKNDRGRCGSCKSPLKSNLQMGQVKILKRGESLTLFQKQNSPDTTPSETESTLLEKKVENQKFSGSTTSFQKENSPLMKKKHENQIVAGHTTMFRNENNPFLKEDENQRVDGGSKEIGAEELLAAARQIRLVDFYAGSAFIASPSPSSLPVPAFFKKNGNGSAIHDTSNKNNNNDDATNDLLRLLNLNL